MVWAANTFTIGAPDPPRVLSYEGASPEFVYDADTGVMTVVPNGHFISDIVVHGIEADSGLLPFPGPNSRGGFVLWEARNFRGKFQAFDGAVNGEDGDFDLAQFAPGLTAADFGQVEWAGWAVPNAPGGADGGWADVTIIPEPATLALLSLGGIAIMARRRRRK